jgi:hypothetical protein
VLTVSCLHLKSKKLLSTSQKDIDHVKQHEGNFKFKLSLMSEAFDEKLKNLFHLLLFQFQPRGRWPCEET